MSLTSHEEVGRVGRVDEDVTMMQRGCYKETADVEFKLISYLPVFVCVCLPHASIVSKRLNGSSSFFAQTLPRPTYPTLRC